MGALGAQVNPRKQWRYAIECEGVETAFCQKVKLPKIEVKSAKHGNGPFAVNTASRVDFGQLEIETLKPAESSAVWWKDWLALLINLSNGAMSDPDVYKKTLQIVEYGADGETIVDMTILYGVYPADIDPGELDKLGDNNVIDKVKFNVDVVTMLGSSAAATAAGLLPPL